MTPLQAFDEVSYSYEDVYARNFICRFFTTLEICNIFSLYLFDMDWCDLFALSLGLFCENTHEVFNIDDLFE